MMKFGMKEHHLSLRKLLVLGAWGYGLWIAGTYLAFKVLVPRSMIETFALSAMASGALLSIARWRELRAAVAEPLAWIRAASFGLTQVFTFRALQAGDTTAVFVASAAAVIVVLPLARFVVGEKVGWQSFAAVGGVVLGTYLIAPAMESTLNGFAAGVFQAAQIVFGRRSGLDKKTLIGNLALGLIVGGVLCSVLARGTLIGADASPISLVVCCLLVLLSQLFFVALTFELPSRAVSQISQTRIAWSVPLNGIATATVPSGAATLGALVVLAAALLASSEVKQESKIP